MKMTNSHSPVQLRNFRIVFIGIGPGCQKPEDYANTYHHKDRCCRWQFMKDAEASTIDHEPTPPQNEGREHLVWDMHHSPLQEFHHGHTIHEWLPIVKRIREVSFDNGVECAII